MGHAQEIVTKRPTQADRYPSGPHVGSEPALRGGSLQQKEADEPAHSTGDSDPDVELERVCQAPETGNQNHIEQKGSPEGPSAGDVSSIWVAGGHVAEVSE